MAAQRRIMGVRMTRGKEIDGGTKIGWPARGLGRWTWCKYCKKSVIPAYFEEEIVYSDGLVPTAMVSCSVCGHGLKRLEPEDIETVRVANGWN